MLYLCLYLSRHHLRPLARDLVLFLVAFVLVWAPVREVRAALPVAVALEVVLSRVFVAAATRVGPALTTTTGQTGLAVIGMAQVQYLNNLESLKASAASYHHSVSGGVPSLGGIASSVGVSSVNTDTTSYSWAPTAGTVTSSVGNVPMKDAIAGMQGYTNWPQQARHDGYTAWRPVLANTYSTVYNQSGFKTYLCPVLSPVLDGAAGICRTLPEMPYAEFAYGVQYGSFGIGCTAPLDCAIAVVAGRLAALSHTINQSAGTDPQGRAYYQYGIVGPSADFGSCYDPRYSQYSAFSGYRCPVALTYSQATLSPGQSPAVQNVTENLVIDVLVQRPSFSTAQTLPQYIDRYPLAGNEPMSPASIATLANAMFLQASSRAGYAGINYFPITAADATASLTGDEMVPLSSLVAPIGTAAPGTTPGTGNPSVPGNPTLDLGPNPAIPAPTLEGIPTAAQIMAPIFDLFPSLRNFEVPGHTSTCPGLSLPLWGQTVSTNAHCEVIESQRSLIGSAALVGWSIAAIIIVLGA